MTSSTPISTPFKYRVRRALTSGLPFLFFILVAGLCGLLWNFQTSATTLVGEVEVIEHLVASPQAGVIARLVPCEGQSLLSVYSVLQQNQLVVQLDDRAVREQLDVVEQEVMRLSDETSVQLSILAKPNSTQTVTLVSKTADDESTKDVPAVDDTANAEVDQQKLLLQKTEKQLQSWQLSADYLNRSQRQLELNRRQLELRRLDTQLRQLGSGPVDASAEAQLTSLTKQRNDLAAHVEEIKTEISFSQSTDIYDLAGVNEIGWSAPLRLQWQSLIRRCRAVDLQLGSIAETVTGLDIVTSVAGQIEEAYVQPLQSVAIGTPLLSVIPTRGNDVIVYARETGPFRPYSGMKVTLRSRLDVRQQIQTVVQSVGPKVESIPTRQRFNPRVEEWGRPMRIQLPEDWVIEPGSLIDVVVTQ